MASVRFGADLVRIRGGCAVSVVFGTPSERFGVGLVAVGRSVASPVWRFLLPFVRFGGGGLSVAFVLSRLFAVFRGVMLSLDKFLDFVFFVEIWAVYRLVLFLGGGRSVSVGLLGGAGAIFYILYSPSITYPFSVKK